MTQTLKEKFIAIVDNENDMWEKLYSYLMTNFSIKAFPRLFTLSETSGKLILTRKSIAKTINIEITSGGYQYDKSLNFPADTVDKNRENLSRYLSLHKLDSYEKQFGTSEVQKHLIVDTSFSEFFNNFLQIYYFPLHSKNIGMIGMKKIHTLVQSGAIEDKLSVIVMRYKEKEYRSYVEINGEKWLKELPQSYNNEKTQYEGDKNLLFFKEKMHMQIHLVYINQDNKEDFYPILAFNNPLSKETIRFVTGDNFYGTV